MANRAVGCKNPESIIVDRCTQSHRVLDPATWPNRTGTVAFAKPPTLDVPGRLDFGGKLKVTTAGASLAASIVRELSRVVGVDGSRTVLLPSAWVPGHEMITSHRPPFRLHLRVLVKYLNINANQRMNTPNRLPLVLRCSFSAALKTHHDENWQNDAPEHKIKHSVDLKKTNKKRHNPSHDGEKYKMEQAYQCSVYQRYTVVNFVCSKATIGSLKFSGYFFFCKWQSLLLLLFDDSTKRDAMPKSSGHERHMPFMLINFWASNIERTWATRHSAGKIPTKLNYSQRGSNRESIVKSHG